MNRFHPQYNFFQKCAAFPFKLVDHCNEDEMTQLSVTSCVCGHVTHPYNVDEY